MKISVVIPSFYPAVVYGGTIFSSLNTSKELARAGHQVFVSTTNTNMYSRLDVETNKFIEIEPNLFVKYYNETIVDRLSIPLLLGIKKDIATADVVHIQAIFNSPTPAALYYASKLRKPILLSPRGVMGDWIMNQGLRFKRQWLNLFIKPYSEKVWWHATSLQEKEEILSHYPNAKVVVIPNGIDLDLFSETVFLSREGYFKKFTQKDKRSGPIIVSMGRIHKKKGFDILIEAFILLKKEFPSAVLLIAGQDEGEKAALEEQIRKSGLADDIEIIPPVHGKDKVAFLANADIFVLPSHNENFGNVYGEALAAGTPIVASIKTPWQEVVNAKCGLWVPNTPIDNFNAITSLLKEDREKLRIASKDYIQTYKWSTIAKKIEEVFFSISK